MYFKKVKIENWAGLYDREIELKLAKELNVVVGPNESGKSTLMNALNLALTTKASSQKKDVEKAQPWNTDLNPQIELEFHFRDKDYRLTKRFLKSTGNAEFCESDENGNWLTVAEGDAAHGRFLGVLNSREGEGFFNTLWVPQGKTIEIDTSKGLTDRIKQAVGTTTSDVGEKILSCAVGKVGDQDNKGWLTKTRRNVASGSPWDKAKEKLEELNGKLNELREKREEHQENLEEIQNLKQEKEALKKRLDQKKKNLRKKKEKKKDWDRFKDLKQSAQEAKSHYLELYDKKKSWDAKLGEIEKTLAKKKTITREIQGLEEKLKAAEEKSANSREKFDRAKSKLEALQDKKGYLEMLRALKINRELAALNGEIEKLGDIDENSFSDWEAVKEEMVSTRKQLRASELKIGFRAESNLTGQIRLDDKEEPIDLTSGDKLERTAAKSLEIELEDIGKLSVETAMEKALEAKKKVEEDEERLAKVYRTYGVNSWSQLRAKYKKIKEKKERASKLRDQLDKIDYEDATSIDKETLKGFVADSELTAQGEFIEESEEKTDGDLAEEVEKIKEKIGDQLSEVENLKGNWKEKEEAVRDVKEEIKTKEGALKVENKALEEKLNTLRDIKERVKATDKRFEDIPIPKQDGEGFDREAEETSELYEELKEVWREARRRKDELEDDLEQMKPEGEEVTGDTIDALKSSRDDLEKRISEKEMSIRELKGSIGKTSDGLHEMIRDKEEEIEREKRKLESAKKETRAHELLRLTFTEAKEETSSEYLEPIRKKVGARLREMTEDRYTRADLDSDLTPTSAVRSLRNTEADSGDLSYGTKEQLSFLTRLAMAEIASRNDRIPVIFDDSLVNTDPQRMEYMRKYLSEAAAKAQIIIFTCNKDQYQFDGDYNRIELDPLP